MLVQEHLNVVAEDLVIKAFVLVIMAISEILVIYKVTNYFFK